MAPIQQQSSSKKRKNNKNVSEPKKNKNKKKKETTLSDVKHLGEELLSSKAYINNLPLLLNYLNPTTSYPREFVLESLLSLQSFFTPLLPHLPSSNAKPTEDPDSIYRTWVRSKFDEFVTCLVGLSVSSIFLDEDEALREVVLDTLMECVKVGNVGKFHSHIYHKFIKNMIFSVEEADTLLNLLVSKYFKYIDIRYFTYISIEKIIGKDVKESSDSEKESTTRA
ncbi:nucleolar complex protein 4 homolog B, partial [Tanacetum coccineum]